MRAKVGSSAKEVRRVRQGCGATWEGVFERWVEPFLSALGHKAQRRWAPVYLRSLLGPGERKSVEPMASRVAPGDVQQLHHFVSTSVWDTGPLETVLVQKAQEMVGGPRAVLIIDDTALVKQGKHSAGVARQFCGELGKKANCQVLVSLTLARGEVPVPIGMKLFLPESWAENPERRRRAGVPEDVVFRTKGQIALEELDRVRIQGAEFGCVLADAGYGNGGEFRRGLSERGLRWTVGILPTLKVYPADVGRHPDPRYRQCDGTCAKCSPVCGWNARTASVRSATAAASESGRVVLRRLRYGLGLDPVPDFRS